MNCKCRSIRLVCNEASTVALIHLDMYLIIENVIWILTRKHTNTSKPNQKRCGVIMEPFGFPFITTAKFGFRKDLFARRDTKSILHNPQVWESRAYILPEQSFEIVMIFHPLCLPFYKPPIIIINFHSNPSPTMPIPQPVLKNAISIFLVKYT